MDTETVEMLPADHVPDHLADILSEIELLSDGSSVSDEAYWGGEA